jgi:hypothetical protein
MVEVTERSWTGGPLRVVGSGNGKPSKYVCDGCLQRAHGVRLDPPKEKWLCYSCEQGKARQTPRISPALGFLQPVPTNIEM